MKYSMGSCRMLVQSALDSASDTKEAVDNLVKVACSITESLQPGDRFWINLNNEKINPESFIWEAHKIPYVSIIYPGKIKGEAKFLFTRLACP